MISNLQLAIILEVYDLSTYYLLSSMIGSSLLCYRILWSEYMASLLLPISIVLGPCVNIHSLWVLLLCTYTSWMYIVQKLRQLKNSACQATFQSLSSCYTELVPLVCCVQCQGLLQNFCPHPSVITHFHYLQCHWWSFAAAEFCFVDLFINSFGHDPHHLVYHSTTSNRSCEGWSRSTVCHLLQRHFNWTIYVYMHFGVSVLFSHHFVLKDSN